MTVVIRLLLFALLGAVIHLPLALRQAEKFFGITLTIEIIDIECVLLSFLSQKFVSTKWRIQKGIFTRFRLLWQGISRGSGE